MHNKLDDDIEEIVAVIARSVNFVIGNEIELWISKIAAENPTFTLVFGHLFHQMFRAHLLHIANEHVSTIERSRNIG